MTIKLGDWLPQEPNQGPPLPEFLNIYWPWYKPPETLGAELAITLSADPGALVPGTTYPAWVKVTNKSTKLGVYVPATLTVNIRAVLAGVAIGTDLTRTDVYPANTQLTVPETGYNFTIPTDGGGKSGTVTATVLDPAGIVLGVAILPITVQAVVAPTGDVGPGLIWYEPLTAWDQIFSGRQIPVGAAIYLSPQWVNTSNFNIIGHIDVLAFRPDGTSWYLTATTNQDKSATPNNGWYIQFSPFTANQEGTYTLTATLSSGGVVLKAVTFNLVAVAQIVYGADVIVSV